MDDQIRFDCTDRDLEVLVGSDGSDGSAQARTALGPATAVSAAVPGGRSVHAASDLTPPRALRARPRRTRRASWRPPR